MTYTITGFDFDKNLVETVYTQKIPNDTLEKMFLRHAHEVTIAPTIDKVYFNDPVTVVIWDDGTKTIVRCAENNTYDKYVGLAMCYLKRMAGYRYSNIRKSIRDYACDGDRV